MSNYFNFQKITTKDEREFEWQTFLIKQYEYKAKDSLNEELRRVKELIKWMKDRSIRDYKWIISLPKSEFSEMFLKSNIIKKVISKNVRIDYREWNVDNDKEFDFDDKYLLNIVII